MKRFKGFVSFSAALSGWKIIVFILFFLNIFSFSFSAEEVLTPSFLSPSSSFEEEKAQILKELNDAEAMADQVLALKTAPPSVAENKQEPPRPLKGKSKTASRWIPTYTGYSSGGLEVDRARIIAPSYDYFVRHTVDTEKKITFSSPASETRKVKDFDADDGVRIPERARKFSGSQTRLQEYQTSGEGDLFLKTLDEKTALLLSMEPREILLNKKIWFEALLRIEAEIGKGARNPYQTSEDKSRLKILKNYFMILLDKCDLALASREAMMKNQVMISG